MECFVSYYLVLLFKRGILGIETAIKDISITIR